MATGFNPKGVWHPDGRGFSMGVIQPDGHVIHFTGQVGWDANENIVGVGDVEKQTRQAYANIEAILHDVGGTLEDLVSVTTYYLDSTHLPIIQKVRADLLSSTNPPTSTSVMVVGLGHRDFLVELAPIAVVPVARFKAPG